MPNKSLRREWLNEVNRQGLCRGNISKNQAEQKLDKRRDLDVKRMHVRQTRHFASLQGQQAYRGDSVVGDTLTVEICCGVLEVLSQAWPSFTTRVFLYLLFLGSDARVLAGRSLRETILAFIALYNARALTCTARSKSLKSASAAGVPYPVAVRRLVTSLFGRLSIGRGL